MVKTPLNGVFLKKIKAAARLYESLIGPHTPNRVFTTILPFYFLSFGIFLTLPFWARAILCNFFPIISFATAFPSVRFSFFFND